MAEPTVIVMRTDDVLRTSTMDEADLTPVEIRRGAAFRAEADRRDYVAAHLLVRSCAAMVLGVEPGELVVEQHCATCRREGHGRPGLAGIPDVAVSMAHTAGVVAAAAGHGPVGVDVETLTSGGPSTEMARRVLTPAEAELVFADPEPEWAFLRYWVCKEALVKIGRATLDTVHELDVSAALAATDDVLQRSGRFGDLHVVQWIDDELAVAAAVVGDRPPRRLLTGRTLASTYTALDAPYV